MRTNPVRSVLVLLALFFCNAMETEAQFWQKCTIPSAYANGYFLDVFFLPSNPQYGWVCGQQGFVLRTTDGGASWQGTVVPYQGRSGGHLESVHFVSQQIGYCSGPCGVFSSSDGGASWTDVSPSMPGGQSPWGLYFLNASWGVVVGGGCGGTQGFALTTNGGASWSYTTGSLPASGMTDALLYANGRGFAVGSGQLWGTLDSGRTWSPFKSSFASIWNEEITHIGSSFLLPYAGSQCAGGGGGGGARFTTDSGATWTSYSTGQPMYGAFLLNATTGWICGNAKSMYRTTDAGVNWELRNCGIDGDLDDCWFINDSTGFVVGNGVYRYSSPERSLSKTNITLGPLCFPGTIYDTVWVRNRSYNGTGATWNLAGTDIQHFDVLTPMSTSFGIPSCDSSMIVIRFQPRSPGTKTITLSVNINNQQTLTAQISATTRTVNAVPSDTLIVVRSAPCGVPVRVVSAWNNASQQTDQVIRVTRLSGDVFSPDPGIPVIIPPGGGSVISTIVLADTGWKSGRYVYRVGPCLKDTVITLRVYGVSPIVNTPSARTYQTSCLQPAYDSIPVSNTGNADLVISTADLIGNTGEFQLAGWNTGDILPVSIAPGVTKYLYLRFVPSGSAPASATLRLSTNDATTVRGIKTVVDIPLRGQSVGVSDSVSSTLIDFGRICAPADLFRTWKVFNTGSASITVSAPSLATRPFNVTSSRPLPAVLSPRDSLSLRIDFSSASVGLFVDSLVIGIDPCMTTPIVIPVRAQLITTSLGVSPQSIRRTLKRGERDTVCVDLRSTGSAEVLLDSLKLMPPQSSMRIISDTARPMRIDTATPRRVCIELTGDSVGTYQATLNTGGSMPCAAYAEVPVTLTVTESRVRVTPEVVDAGDMRCVAKVRYDTLQIENEGSVADTLLEARIVAVTSGTSFVVMSPSAFPVVLPAGARIIVIIKSELLYEGVDTATCALLFSNAFQGMPYAVPLRASFRTALTAPSDMRIDLGTFEPCDAPKTFDMTFTNSGTLDDTLTLRSNTPNAAWTGAFSPVVVPALASSTVRVRFDAGGRTEQSLNDTLIWQSIVCNSVVRAQLSARIIAPRLSISPTSIDAGSLWKGSVSRRSVTIWNASSGTRRLLRWYVRGQDAAEFSLIDPPRTTLAPGDTTSLIVEALSRSVGAHDAELVIVETSSCTDSTVVSLRSQTPREIYRAHLSLENGVVADVNDNADMHVVLVTNDSADDALFKASPTQLNVRAAYDARVMNIIGVYNPRSGRALSWSASNGDVLVRINASDVDRLGQSDTVAVVRAQGMQSIPNVTDVNVTSFTGECPPDKELELTWDNGDFAVQSCVNWARVTVIEPLAIRIRNVPANDEVLLDVHNSATSDLHVRMYTATGELLLDYSVMLSSPSGSIAIPVRDVATGVYMLVVEDAASQRCVKPLVVRH